MDCRRFLLFGLFGLLTTLMGCTVTSTIVRPGGPQEAQEDPEAKFGPATWLAKGDLFAGSCFGTNIPEAQQQFNREQARLTYRKALDVDPKFLPAMISLARFEAQCGNIAAARGWFEKALAIEDKEATMWGEYGGFLCRHKQWPEAITSLQRACDLAPNNKKFSVTLGLALARAGRYGDSLPVLIKAEGEAKAHYHLARMMCHTNRFDEGRKHLELALQFDAQLPGAKEMLARLDAGDVDGIKTVSYQSEPQASTQMSSSPLPSMAVSTQQNQPLNGQPVSRNVPVAPR
jgi:tetratricopeptide (TPR) repeat protein